MVRLATSNHGGAREELLKERTESCGSRGGTWTVKRELVKEGGDWKKRGIGTG